MKLIYCKSCKKNYTKYYINSHLRSVKHLTKSGCLVDNSNINLKEGLKFERKNVIVNFK